MNEDNNNFFQKLVIAYVLYNPSIEVSDGVNMFLKRNIEVYVFENSKSNLNLVDKNLTILGNQTNQGLGIALKQMERKAIDNQKEFIFYLDQDTYITNQIFRILMFYQQYLILDKKCISINLKDNPISILKNAPITINSASLFHLPKLNKIGLHSGKLFLDGIDFEFSLRARKNGFVLMKGKSFNSINHNINQDGGASKFIGRSHVLFKKYPKSRYINIINISLHLLLKSILIPDILYALEIVKFLLVFIITQIFSSMFKFFNKKLYSSNLN